MPANMRFHVIAEGRFGEGERIVRLTLRAYYKSFHGLSIGMVGVFAEDLFGRFKTYGLSVYLEYYGRGRPAFLVLLVLKVSHDLPEQRAILVAQLLLLAHVGLKMFEDPAERREVTASRRFEGTEGGQFRRSYHD